MALDAAGNLYIADRSSGHSGSNLACRRRLANYRDRWRRGVTQRRPGVCAALDDLRQPVICLYNLSLIRCLLHSCLREDSSLPGAQQVLQFVIFPEFRNFGANCQFRG